MLRHADCGQTERLDVAFGESIHELRGPAQLGCAVGREIAGVAEVNTQSPPIQS